MRDTIDMAREAGWKDLRDYDSEMRHDFFMGNTDSLKAFEALVRADEREVRSMRWDEYIAKAIEAEREACAKVCDEQVERSLAAVEKAKRTTDHRIYRAAAQTATWNAAAIRARSKDEK
jgi:hypothetical protein